MRVKKYKQDDLVNALRQLKISDRRSRLSLRGRVSNSAAYPGGSSSGFALPQSFRSHLTRSASSATSVTRDPCDFPHTCEYCLNAYRIQSGLTEGRIRQSLDGSIHLGDDASSGSLFCRSGLPELSGFSPFTSSAGLLYSTLPTGLEFPSVTNSDSISNPHLLQSTQLRRSCGAGLGRVDCEPIPHLTSTSRSSFGSMGTGDSDRHHRCILHHGVTLTPLSIQMRLYRRLYSLIDHPCVSLYHSYRSFGGCAHRPQAITSVPHRYSLSLRHRHTVTPSMPHRLNPDLKAPAQDTPVQTTYSPTPGAAWNEVSAGQETSSGFMTTFTSDPFTVAKSPTSYDPTRNEAKTPISSGILSQLTSFEAGDQVNDAQPNLRCRRNSDPECWQQIRTGQNVEHTKSSRTPTSTNCSASTTNHSSQFSRHVTRRLVGRPCVRPGVLSPPNADGSARSVQPTSIRSSAFLHTTQYSSNHLEDNCKNLNANPTPISMNIFPQPIERSHPSAGDSEGSAINFPKFRYSGDSSQWTFRTPFSSSAVPNLTGELSVDSSQQAAPMSLTGKKNPWGVGNAVRNTQMDTASVHPGGSEEFDPSEPKLMRMMQSLRQELAALDDTDSPSSVASRQPLAPDDVSVNELAAYMEHMVHIPGRMSEMAQRMYL
ncbi:hypothetical protein P879_10166 [Paragonimus westermani]|uniref:Uncharacterized protein n=1 Tax=Paragonimus westermani TaxID=34504 RepID=A0A8T0D4E7_9TREM|nr:hypothetical protein P879_10166 [Paragonimus westermani]